MREQAQDPERSSTQSMGPPTSAPESDVTRPTEMIGELAFAVTADGNQMVETMERIRKGAEAFVRAYSEPVDMVPLDDQPKGGWKAAAREGFDEALESGRK